MQLLKVKIMEDVFTPGEKRRMLRKLTGAMASIKSSSLGQTALVVDDEDRPGNWMSASNHPPFPV